MTVGVRTDPYLGYRFLVEIDSLIVGGFSEVTGLELRRGTEDYREGGTNHYTHKLPTHFDQQTLTLRRGMTDSPALWEWIRNAADGGLPSERKNVRIVLLDSVGDESWGWEFQSAYPVRWTGPELQADSGAVAVETLELAHEGVNGISGLPAGGG